MGPPVERVEYGEKNEEAPRMARKRKKKKKKKAKEAAAVCWLAREAETRQEK